jgi:hypothetical protein
MSILDWRRRQCMHIRLLSWQLAVVKISMKTPVTYCGK